MRNTGQRSLCTITAQAVAQAVAQARIDDWSVERSICVTRTAYVWVQTKGTNRNTCSVYLFASVRVAHFPAKPTVTTT